jgi:MFS family permease
MEPATESPSLRLGLRANWPQFALLIVVNVFVGALVGVERAVLPLLAESDFALASRAAILSFIGSFGLAKASANLAAGALSDRLGRKPVLLAGWLIGLPVPILVMVAPSWDWVVLANVLLGLNQGLCWSLTVVMKVDLAGAARRGLAMGLNEAGGYGAVAASAFAAAALAQTFGTRPYPFVLALGFAAAGLVLSALVVRETRPYAHHEAGLQPDLPASKPDFREVFLLTSWRNRVLFAVSQAGLVNNLNDGMAWGLLPLFFAEKGLDLVAVGALAAVYPAVWGLGQLLTGALSDRVGRKGPVVAGMWLQAAAIAGLVIARGEGPWALAMGLLGAGTALVYPTLLAAVSDVARPAWRASAVGVYRLWRDTGYAVGAVLAGVLADLLGVPWAIGGVAALTFLSGLVALVWMRETLPAGSRTLRRC